MKKPSSPLKKLSFHSPLFDLRIGQTGKVTAIDMQVHGLVVNTSEIPETLNFLEENYPGVLRTQCFNDKNLPFSTEVIQTEIGHLFEHILIDNLCALKIRSGAKSAIFNGTTSWNWQQNPYGSFQIWIDVGREELELLIEGLKITIDLTKKLMEAGNRHFGVEDNSYKNLRATV